MFDEKEQNRAAEPEGSGETRGMNRRAFLSNLGKAAAGSALLTTFHGMLSVTPPPGACHHDGVGWRVDERIAEAYYKPYTEKSGSEVKIIPYSTPKVLAMHEAGKMEIDFILGAGLDTLMFIEKGVVEPIDWSVVDKSALTNQLAYGATPSAAARFPT